MFDDVLYSKFRSTDFHRRYVIYCVIGASAFFVIGVIITVIAALGCAEKSNPLAPLAFIPAALCFAVPLGFIVSARKKPYICAKGTIVSIKGNKAIVKAGDITVKNAVSFEKFLDNAPLKNYSAGDEVVLVSFTKRSARPMFYREEN